MEQEIKEETLDTSVKDFGFSRRARNCFIHHGIKTVGKLLEHTPEELLKLTKFGKKTLQEVRVFLWKKGGLRLKNDRWTYQEWPE